MTYPNPEDYLDEEEEKEKQQRRWSIKKALKMAKMNKTKEEPADVDKKDILEAAKDFNEWVKDGDKSSE